jgi:hypothetical protein
VDIQKISRNEIIVLNEDKQIDIEGKLCIPVSWIYFQLKLHNIEEMDTSELMKTLGGRMILDVLVNSKRDEEWKSTLRFVELAIIDLENGNDKLYFIGNHRIYLTIGEKKVNSLNFKYLVRDCWKDKEGNKIPNYAYVAGDYANEFDFNSRALLMVKPYGLKLKQMAVCHDAKELFN